MGEMAEMMSNGIMCGMCGVFLGELVGHPLYCSKECAIDANADLASVVSPPEDYPA